MAVILLYWGPSGSYHLLAVVEALLLWTSMPLSYYRACLLLVCDVPLSMSPVCIRMLLELELAVT